MRRTNFRDKVDVWCISKASNTEGFRFQYWKIKRRFQVRRAKMRQRIRMYYAGFCSRGRGAHLNRELRIKNRGLK
jgi:hypothetical protein